MNLYCITNYELPYYDVHLPLKYKEELQSDSSPNDIFNSKLVVYGDILKLQTNGISFTILQDLKTIIFKPVDFESGGKYAIRINLPNKLISTNSIDVSLTNDRIILNLIDESFLFITILVNLDNFVNPWLSLDRFDKWGHISIPYSFELRSSLYYLKNINENNIIVSLKDGGLLHFRRDNVFDDLKVFNFHEPTSLIPFLGFFKKDIVLNGISANSVIDLVVRDHILITLTVSKQLKIWNLDNHQLVKTVALSKDDIWLTSIPKKYLQLNGDILTLFINEDSKFIFKSFNSNFEKADSFIPESPGSKWFIQDYQIQNSYYILWKSNTSSILGIYNNNNNNNNNNNVIFSKLPTQNEEISAFHEESYYFNKIFNSGLYNSLIVDTSLSILSQHVKTKGQNNDSRLFAIEILVTKSLWFKFYQLCEEYKKLSNEVFSLTLFDNLYLSVQSNGIGVFKESQFYESFNGEIINVFEKIKGSISFKTYHKIYQSLLKGEDIDNLYKSYIKMSNTEQQSILDELSKIPNVLDTIKSIINNNDYEMLEAGQINPLGHFGKNLVITSFQSLIEVHKYLLIDLAILFSICESNDQINELFNQVISNLKHYQSLEIIIETNPAHSGISNVENSMFWSMGNQNFNQLLSNLKINDAFEYLSNVFSNSDYLIHVIMELINENKSKELKIYYLDKLGNSDIERVLKGLIYLINNGYNEAYSIFENYESFKDLEIKILRRLSTPGIGKFVTRINKFGKADYYYQLSTLTLTIFTHNSTEEKSQIETSTKLLKLAIEASENTSHIEKFQLQIFHNSLRVSNFEAAVDSLTYLEDNPQFGNLIEKLILRLIKDDFKFIMNEDKLFKKHYYLIDGIISKAADVSNSLTIHKYLYSFRLNHSDKRSAIETLYQFITDNKDSNIKVKLIELYLTILNLMKCLQDDEKWILKEVEGVREVVNLNELTIEYLKFIENV
ncbi:unnamed protein product [Candida verbasci]|uniref:Nucleoporin Nup120/160 beta-propeller domain-containing protein n=1 Tax=Candida verbasci TaxID=1227364 RepID=A0A9W4U0Q8_9ASCO|nr:unnamed protein product [Candida verbasci]